MGAELAYNLQAASVQTETDLWDQKPFVRSEKERKACQAAGRVVDWGMSLSYYAVGECKRGLKNVSVVKCRIGRHVQQVRLGISSTSGEQKNPLLISHMDD